MRKILLWTVLLITREAFGQTEVVQDYTAFVQGVDITAFRGGQFRFRGSVRVENGSRLTRAALWARVDTKKGMGFFDNMSDRPIMSAGWTEYVIEGPVDPSAVRIGLGGITYGVGKYYFDNLILEVKRKEGEWEQAPLKNTGFEADAWNTGWRPTQNVQGFVFLSTMDDKTEGSKALLIDATSRPSNSRFLEANGITIHHKQFGVGDTVLLLHGNGESIESFDKQIPELSKWYHVIAMDSRGQGYTSEDGKRLTYELMAEDVNAFLDNLGAKRVHLLGWSDGGNIGLILAMKHPEKIRSLATMGANLYNNATSVDGSINKQLIKQREQLVKRNNPNYRFRLDMIDMLLTQPNIQPESLNRIQCPALVMAGSKDAIKEPHTRLIAASIPGAQLVIFDKGTHYEPKENPERFNKVVLTFLNSVR